MSAVSMVTLKGQDEKVAPGTFTILQILYTPSILHLTLTHHNQLAIKALLCVRYYQFHLHTTCTQPAHNLHATCTQPAQPTCSHTAQAREGDITA